MVAILVIGYIIFGAIMFVWWIKGDRPFTFSVGMPTRMVLSILALGGIIALFVGQIHH